MTQSNIKQILDSLSTLQEQLMSLPDDMLLSIDPRDNDSLDKGTAFIKSFNNNMQLFAKSASGISEQIKLHFGINPEMDDLEQETLNRGKRDRIIRELDKNQAFSLKDDFTYKRPYGFVLDDMAVKGIKTWKSMYLIILHHLKAVNPALFEALPSTERFISKRGNPLFSPSPQDLRVPEKLDDHFFIEVNLSANMIRRNITDLLSHFSINPLSMKVYMREDRDSVE